MRARELVEEYPTVRLDTDAMEAARMLAHKRLVGLIVSDGDGKPYTVLPGSQVLKFLVPQYVQDDPALARVYDEKASDELCAALTKSVVRDLLPSRQDVDEIPIVDPDATVIEMAAVMARVHSPVIAVVDKENHYLGAVTVRRLLEHLLPGA